MLVIKFVSSSLFAALHNSLTLVVTLKAWLVRLRWFVSLFRSAGTRIPTTVCFPNKEVSKSMLDRCMRVCKMSIQAKRTIILGLV